MTSGYHLFGIVIAEVILIVTGLQATAPVLDAFSADHPVSDGNRGSHFTPLGSERQWSATANFQPVNRWPGESVKPGS